MQRSKRHRLIQRKGHRLTAQFRPDHQRLGPQLLHLNVLPLRLNGHRPLERDRDGDVAGVIVGRNGHVRDGG